MQSPVYSLYAQRKLPERSGFRKQKRCRKFKKKSTAPRNYANSSSLGSVWSQYLNSVAYGILNHYLVENLIRTIFNFSPQWREWAVFASKAPHLIFVFLLWILYFIVSMLHSSGRQNNTIAGSNGGLLSLKLISVNRVHLFVIKKKTKRKLWITNPVFPHEMEFCEKGTFHLSWFKTNKSPH